MGDMSLGGTTTPARNLAESLQVAFDAGAKRILLPMCSVTDIPTVPGELFAKFQTSFYSDPVDAVFSKRLVWIEVAEGLSDGVVAIRETFTTHFISAADRR